ncbi:MAG: DUF5054 domain-containing protein, partial [Planctomycetota bacterium]
MCQSRMTSSSQTVKQVNVVFKTHLDLGFTDLAANVAQNYFDTFIPAAMETARILRKQGGTARFVWTTGSWLIYQYLEQASPAERRCMEEAIGAGDLVWHALPFTTHTELMDEQLFRFGLSLSRELDQRFGRSTIAAKMTDVPGHTRAIIPLLAEAGVEYLHLGVNHSSSSPDVPPLFRWQDPDGEEVIINYAHGYGAESRAPGLSTLQVFAHTGDNLGPPSPEDVEQSFAELVLQYPGAVVRAASMEDFAKDLQKVRHDLPIVTQEIADTWIHGAGTDPTKVSRFRAL